MRMELGKSDAVEFTSRVERLIRSAIAGSTPPEFYVVKLDNWFGP